ncbi:MAG: T9SS type A sorting domain-containing protein, partial [Candidatus Neomarinimicrobiota bacterium]
FDRRMIEYYRDTLDCSYPTTAAAYTGADGIPVGDLNWFPEFVGVSEEKPAGPVSFSLKQNYPNPFNPTTQIAFNLDKSGYTVLSIYNLLGQIVAKPVANHLPAGSYQITFDASHLAGGIYFYKLESAGQVNVRKMMLLK